MDRAFRELLAPGYCYRAEAARSNERAPSGITTATRDARDADAAAARDRRPRRRAASRRPPSKDHRTRRRRPPAKWAEPSIRAISTLWDRDKRTCSPDIRAGRDARGFPNIRGRGHPHDGLGDSPTPGPMASRRTPAYRRGHGASNSPAPCAGPATRPSSWKENCASEQTL